MAYKPFVMIYIRYEEFVPGTYAGVQFSKGDGTLAEVNTGDPVEDFRFAVKTLRDRGADVYLSSTCDDFVVDHKGQYEWKTDKELGNLIVKRKK